MQSRRICCSQCGGEGHTMQNTNCPINIERRQRPYEEDDEYMLHRAFRTLVAADELIVSMEEWFHQYEASAITADVFIERSIDATSDICYYIREINTRLHTATIIESLEEQITNVNRVLRLRQEQTPELVGCLLLSYRADGPFSEFVEMPQQWITDNEVNRAPYEIHVEYRRRPNTPQFDRPSAEEGRRRIIRPAAQLRPRIIQRTNQRVGSDYLKACSIVQDIQIDETTSFSMCQCPICLDEVTHQEAIHTNCNHTYCFSCIKELSATMKTKTQKPRCPMCRTTFAEFRVERQEIYNEMRNYFSTL